MSSRNYDNSTGKRSVMDSLQDPDTGAWSESKLFALPWQPLIRANGWTRRKLWPYRSLNKLYGERKYANNYPLQPFRIMDLPAEIRNRIYEFHLCFDPIELSAKAASANGNRKATKHHSQRYARDISPRLRLLRVSKQVNREAAYVFYGGNEFRFSSMHGHDMLFAFCRTIGKRNTACLRKITEHAPWGGQYPEEAHDRPAHTNVTSWGNFQSLTRAAGLHEKGHGAWSFNIMRTLTRRNGGVKEYRLVLPDHYELQQGDSFATANIGRSLLPYFKKATSADVFVVLLEPPDDFGEPGHDDYLEVQLRRKLKMMSEAQELGWQVLYTKYDKLGHYDLTTALIIVQDDIDEDWRQGMINQ